MKPVKYHSFACCYSKGGTSDASPRLCNIQDCSPIPLRTKITTASGIKRNIALRAFSHGSSLQRKPRKGFTLIELILAVAILALLGGAVAGILQGSVASAVALTEVSNRQSQVQSFLQLLNTTFRNLGTETTFMAQKNPMLDQTNLFLMFNGASQLFNWHRDQSKFPAKLLTWWPNDKGVLS
ncbi:MAG: type II secretion system protein, partial [Verrucomicrobiota bacterium]